MHFDHLLRPQESLKRATSKTLQDRFWQTPTTKSPPTKATCYHQLFLEKAREASYDICQKVLEPSIVPRDVGNIS